MKVFAALFFTTDAEYNCPNLVLANNETELFEKALAVAMDAWDHDGSASNIDELQLWFQEAQEEVRGFIYTYEEETDVEKL